MNPVSFTVAGELPSKLGGLLIWISTYYGHIAVINGDNRRAKGFEHLVVTVVMHH